MKTTNNPGTDYSAGQPINRNPQTGFRYGVIPSRDLCHDAFDDIVQNGTDEDFESYKAEIKNALSGALSDFCSTSKLAALVESAFDAISDDVCDNYQGTGDCTRYSYDVGGLKLQVASDGDIFIIESPYFTYAQFCSPCAPGACYLRSPLESPVESNKCYCLGLDWFSDESPCPYPVYSVATGEIVKA